jgi:hypothetical protein
VAGQRGWSTRLVNTAGQRSWSTQLVNVTMWVGSDMVEVDIGGFEMVGVDAVGWELMRLGGS